MPDDEFYMARALMLAQQGRFTTPPNPNVGCVIVRDGAIVGEGFHLRAGEPHAEVHALRMAGDRAQGATAYVTLEPCSHYGRTPPCAEALVNAGIARVVVAMSDPNPQVAGQGIRHLQQAGIEVRQGVMGSEAEALNPGFLKRMRSGLPYIQLKMGCSLDGRTAMASGESQWITSPQARQDVQRYRAASAAILSSSVTVLADDPALTVRWQELDDETQRHYPRAAAEEVQLRQPLRVIVDSANRMTPQLRLFQQPGAILLARLQEDGQSWPANVEQRVLPAQEGRVDLIALMQQLAQRQINQLWVEAGAQLAGALLQAGLVDEVILYMAPKLLGDNARGVCQLPGVNRLCEGIDLHLLEVCKIGPDLRLCLKPNNIKM